MHRSMPFFSNLRKLTFGTTRKHPSYTDFLNMISTNAPNLEIIELRDTVIMGGWLENMQNLRELLICRSAAFTLSKGLTSCFMVNPKLEVFKFMGSLDITTIGGVLSKYCSGLKEFVDVNWENPYEHFDMAMINCYSFLSTLLHLNKVTLKSFSFCGCDLYYTLTILATKCTNYATFSSLFSLSTNVGNSIYT